MKTRYVDSKRTLYLSHWIYPFLSRSDVSSFILVLNVFFARTLSNHLKNQPVIVNTVNPGLCYSELLREMSNPLVWLFRKLLARTAEQGSRQLVWAAVGTPKAEEESLDDLRGAYINLAQINEPADFVLGEEGKKREDKLWVCHATRNSGFRIYS